MSLSGNCCDLETTNNTSIKDTLLNLVVQIDNIHSPKVIETLFLQEKLRIYQKLVDKVDLPETRLQERLTKVVNLDFLR